MNRQSINLIPAAHLRARQRRRRVQWWIRGAAAYALVLTALYAVCQTVSGHGDRALAAELADADQQITATQSEMKSLLPKLTEAHHTLEASRAVVEQPDWSILLAMLAQTLDEQIVLQRCALGGPDAKTARQADTAGPGEYVLALSGVGRSQTDVSQFVLRLERSGLFQQVKLVQTAVTTFLAAPAVRFELACHFGDAES